MWIGNFDHRIFDICRVISKCLLVLVDPRPTGSFVEVLFFRAQD
jgi:hypothetical protein